MDSFRSSESDRRIARLIQYGTVEEADYPAARIRVRMGDALSYWLPWMTQRAGNDRSWWAPEIGEQVVVLSPSGECAQGIVLGSIFQAAHPAPADSPDIDRRVYADGAVIEYDRAKHRLYALIPGDVYADVSRDVTVKAGGSIVAQAGAQISLTAPDIALNGTIVLNGPVTQGGGSNGGDARLNGKLHVVDHVTTDADVTARVSLNGHTHDCPHGGETGAPK